MSQSKHKEDHIRGSWKEFCDSGLLWFINSGLRIFGRCIVIVYRADGSVVDAYPATVKREVHEEADRQGRAKFLNFKRNLKSKGLLTNRSLKKLK